MQDTRFRLIHLYRASFASRKFIHRVLQHDPSLQNLYQWTPTEMQSLFLISKEKANQVYYNLHEVKISEKVKNDLLHYHIWTIIDDDYPFSLRFIPDPPVVLYGLGKRDFLTYQPSLSVVGTRNPSKEAKVKMLAILGPLIKEDWLFVSGMALGIDGLAHRLAYYYQGKTIAVLGSGLQHIYPKQHEELFQGLTTDHLVISEYPPDIPPRKYHFPERNRIISGLSFGTIVIEAKEKSGSLITVDQALEQGREVYAVPGSPLLVQTQGCHKMIQDGAKLVRNAYDLTVDWNENKEKWHRTLSNIDHF
ncbi:DNA-processing protein DprA [Paraliobacillus salinarum]|uniref:DNA-processing protein DprA n=1 Tax=Paraliobacillus salinarum TaxID=1158996 RepID=UPI0015F45E82|nr:DNA-processing protein DprA [Paraliobacillus salinarum]